jgi:hypothetical protein
MKEWYVKPLSFGLKTPLKDFEIKLNTLVDDFLQ